MPRSGRPSVVQWTTAEPASSTTSTPSADGAITSRTQGCSGAPASGARGAARPSNEPVWLAEERTAVHAASRAQWRTRDQPPNVHGRAVVPPGDRFEPGHARADRVGLRARKRAYRL